MPHPFSVKYCPLRIIWILSTILIINILNIKYNIKNYEILIKKLISLDDDWCNWIRNFPTSSRSSSSSNLVLTFSETAEPLVVAFPIKDDVFEINIWTPGLQNRNKSEEAWQTQQLQWQKTGGSVRLVAITESKHLIPPLFWTYNFCW